MALNKAESKKNATAVADSGENARKVDRDVVGVMALFWRIAGETNATLNTQRST